jgi:hypothetical protein
MKSFVRSAIATVGLSAALAASAFAAEEPGYIDIGQLMPSAKGEFVEVNLSPGLLKFAARIARHHEPDAAALVADLQRIRINVVELDDTNRTATLQKFDDVRRKLEAQGWTPMVTVREKNGGDNVSVHAKQRSEDVIDGLVITVIDRKGEAVFVNIVGNISADRIGELAEKYDIEPLRRVKVKVSKT